MILISHYSLVIVIKVPTSGVLGTVINILIIMNKTEELFLLDTEELILIQEKHTDENRLLLAIMLKFFQIVFMEVLISKLFRTQYLILQLRVWL